MPSLSRRRENDGRADRFESEIRDTEFANQQLRAKKELYMCSNCGKGFEEKSRNCPRCDKKTMGVLRPIPEQFKEEARRKAIERARARAAR